MRSRVGPLFPEDCSAEIFEESSEGLLFSNEKHIENDGEKGCGLVLDIGTTTLAFYLADLFTGRTIGEFSELNPQRAYGADVISRISSAKDNLSAMNKLVIERTKACIERFGKKIKKLFVTGNTTMLHLFMNKDVSSLGEYPFTPLFTETLAFRQEIG